MQTTVAMAKALADETRLRALLALRGGELCVCQLIELLGFAPSTVSKHMSILRAAGLVESEKRGKWVYYRLADKGADDTVTKALSWALDAAAGSPRAREDAGRLKAVLRKVCRVRTRSECRS